MRLRLSSVVLFLAWMCATVATLVSLQITLQNPAPVLWVAYVLVMLPPMISTWALWHPWRGKTVVAAALLVALAFASFSLGLFFMPATLLMLIAAALPPAPPQD